MGSNDELMASAIMGDEAKRFMSSELGRLVCGLADQEVAAAVEDLVKADPADAAKMRQIQLQAAIGARFKEWLTNLINDGEESLSAFRQQQEGRHE